MGDIGATVDMLARRLSEAAYLSNRLMGEAQYANLEATEYEEELIAQDISYMEKMHDNIMAAKYWLREVSLDGEA